MRSVRSLGAKKNLRTIPIIVVTAIILTSITGVYALSASGNPVSDFLFGLTEMVGLGNASASPANAAKPTRAGQTSTKLPDGRTILIGGRDSSGRVNSAVE